MAAWWSRPQRQINDSMVLRQATVTLNNNEIKALPTAAVAVSDAPGEGKVCVFITGAMQFLFSGGAYTNVNANATLSFQNELTRVSSSASQIAAVLANPATQGALFVPSILFQDPLYVAEFGGEGISLADAANLPIEVSATNALAGNFTGGNAANALIASVQYLVYDVARGRYV